MNIAFNCFAPLALVVFVAHTAKHYKTTITRTLISQKRYYNSVKNYNFYNSYQVILERICYFFMEGIWGSDLKSFNTEILHYKNETCFLRQHLPLGRARCPSTYSLGTIVNTPFLQVSSLIFGNDTGTRVQGRLSLCTCVGVGTESLCAHRSRFLLAWVAGVSHVFSASSRVLDTRVLEISSLALKHQRLLRRLSFC